MIFIEKKSSFFLIIVFYLLAIQGCVDRIDRVLIEGEFKESPKTYLFISKFESDSLALIDSFKTSSKGKFSFELKTENPTFISIGLQKKQSQIILLIQPGDEVRVYSSNPNLSDYYVLGSKGSALVQILSKKLQDTKNQIDSLKYNYITNLQNSKIDSIKNILDSLYQIKLKNHKEFVHGFIMDNTFSPASILALFQAYDSLHPVFDYTKDRKLFRLVDSTLMSVYSSNKIVLDYHSKIQKLDSLFERRNKRDNMFKIGETLPNIGFPIISGESLFYSGIWYKYMLINFGGAGCTLCDKNENAIKSLFKEFSPKGLALVQVSLGVNADSLKAKIVRDSITWHSASLPDMYNSNLLDTLKVSSIPSNYIIDRWGVIKAVNLHGEKLRLKLNELMPK